MNEDPAFGHQNRHEALDMRLRKIAADADGKIALPMSMQRTGCVILHAAVRNRLKNIIVPMMVDTGMHFPETMELVSRYEDEFDIEIQRLTPIPPDIVLLELNHGDKPYETDEGINECCHLRKFEPMKRALETGNFRTSVRGLMQSTRNNGTVVSYAATDTRLAIEHTVIHLLYDWEPKDVDEYIQRHGLPVHDLYSQTTPDGRVYKSIGCWPCTSPVLPHEDPRSGRWKGRKANACGLNQIDVQAEGSGI